MNVVTINTYGGSLLLGAKAARANILATMEDCGYGSDLQALNFPKVPRFEKTEDWPDRFIATPWRDIDVIAHPPCASFSIMAGRYKTNRGTESDGFECHRRVMDYALGHRCRTLAIESVTGAYAGGKDAYEETAKRYGYRVNYIFLNAASFGVPQWRPRVWMLFHHVKTLRIELRPHYVLAGEVLIGGKVPVPDMLGGHGGHVWNLWEQTKKSLKGRKPTGHIFQALRELHGLESYEEVRKKFPHACGYVSNHVRFIDPNWFSTTILGNTILVHNDKFVSTEEYCSLMGFPRNYEWGRRLRSMRTYLSKGVCPPIATWILKMMDRNMRGWTGQFTHECAEFGGVIDLRPKYEEILTTLGRSIPAKETRQKERMPSVVIKARPAPPAPRGKRYRLVDETRCVAPKSPQAAFILKELRRAGKRGMTRAELTAAAITAGQVRFPINQPHERAVGFFLSKFKGSGGLEFVP
jgi:site-specific DNA-cytosine methylase